MQVVTGASFLKRGTLCTALLLLSASAARPAVGTTAQPAAAEKAPPNSSRECAICHIRWVGAFDRSEIQAGSMQAVMERQAGSGDMCLSCHDGSVVDSRFKVWSTRHHTTDAKPSPAVTIPTETFPLDDQGRMTCATCHTAHAVAGNSDLRTVIFLRQPNVDSSLCLACHPRHAQKSDRQHPLGRRDLPVPKAILDAGGKTSADGHMVFCQTCHEPHGARNAWMLVLPPSELCIACHTDKAPEVSPPAGAPVHRIGHTYTGFKPPASLLEEKATFGPNGELGCLSCHRLHDASGAKPLLIRRNENSTLCLECHEKEKAVLGSPHDLRTSSPETPNAHGDKPSESGPCGACHRIHGWARNVPETGRAHSSGCMECHKPGGPGSHNRPYVDAHPVGVPVKDSDLKSEISDFPLPLDAASGTIGCPTCHDPHIPWPQSSEQAGTMVDEGKNTRSGTDEMKKTGAEGRKNEARTGDSLPASDLPILSPTYLPSILFLRREGSQLCVLCHEKTADALQGPHDPTGILPSLRQTLGADPSVGSCRVCHVMHNAQGLHLSARAPAETSSSPVSNLCMACHDGKLLKEPQTTHHLLSTFDVGFQISDFGSQKSTDPNPQSATRNPRSADVSCTSCHDPHRGAQPAAQLRRPAGGLCVSCHKDKQAVRGSLHDPGANEWGKNLRFGPTGGESAEQDVLCLGCHPIHGPAPRFESQISDLKFWPSSSPRGPGGEEDKKTGMEEGRNAPSGADEAKSGGTEEGKKATREGDKSPASDLPASASLCETCHSAAGPGKAMKTPHVGKTPRGTVDGRKNTTEEGKSTTGESDDLLASHPPAFSPSYLPALAPFHSAAGPDMPIRCPTCHDIHQSGGNAKLLRMARSDSSLCLACHSEFGRILDSSHDLRTSAPQTRNICGELASESGPCGSCHLMHPPSAASTDSNFKFQISNFAAGNGTWAQRLPSGDSCGKGLCTGCHSAGQCAGRRVPRYADHPEVALVNRTLSAAASLEPGFSLAGLGQADIAPTFDDRGRLSPTGAISCPTCHQVHGSPSISGVEVGPPSPPRAFLRTSRQTLCADCHGAQALWRFLYYHKAERDPERQHHANAPAVDAGNGDNRPSPPQ